MKSRKRNRPFSFHSASLFTFSEGNVDSVSVHKRLLMFIQMVGLCQVVVVVKHERAQLSQHRPQVTVQYSTVQYNTVQYSIIQYSTIKYSTVQYSTVQ